MYLITTGGALLLFGFLLGTSRTIRRAMRRREHALSGHAIRELLETTLASIGDAVLTTDATGRLTFANPTAQALLRWPCGDDRPAPGGGVSDYPRIQPRPRGGPVVKVLRGGPSWAWPAIRCSWRGVEDEVPIDDGAAPIRDTAETLWGIVLVFRDITERRRAEGRQVACWRLLSRRPRTRSSAKTCTGSSRAGTRGGTALWVSRGGGDRAADYAHC